MSQSRSRRVERVERELQQVIATYLLSHLKGPHFGLMSVAHVAVGGDLRQAKVYVSVLGSEQDKDLMEEALNEQRVDVQNYISQKLRMKFCPRLRFYVGQTPEVVAGPGDEEV